MRHMAVTTKPCSRVRTTSTDVTGSVTSAGIRLISRETAVMGAVMFFSIGRSGENRKLFLLGRHLDDTIGPGFAIHGLGGVALDDLDGFDRIGADGVQ